jgi:hypothetical protein
MQNQQHICLHAYLSGVHLFNVPTKQTFSSTAGRHKTSLQKKYAKVNAQLILCIL